MKKSLSLITVMVLLIPSFSFGQSAKDAYKALKKIEAKVEVGIGYKDYMNTLGDAQYEVNLYSQSAEATKESDAVSLMKNVLNHYRLAGVVWGNMVTGTPPTNVTRMHYDARMQYHWQEASKELRELSKYLNF
jgi:hypothetical protein